MMAKAERLLQALFDAFTEDPKLLPENFQAHARRLESSSESGLARGIADYIAGMTDRYAIREHDRIFDLRKLI